MGDTELTQILRRRESHPQGVESGSYQDSPTGFEGNPTLGEQHDFRTAALPSDQSKVRKSVDGGDPYSLPFKVSRVYEIAPVGGSGVQYIAQASEGNGRFIEQLDFEAHTFMVDNLSNQWIYCPGVKRFIAPWRTAMVANSPQGTGVIEVRFIAPSGLAQAGAVAAQFVSIQAYEGFLAPSPGIDLTGLVTGTGVQSENLAQMGGTALGGTVWSSQDAVTNPAPTLPVDAYAHGVNPSGSWDRLRTMSSVADGLGVALASQPSSTPTNNSPAVNTAAVITYGAVAGQRHRLTRLSASYNAAPTGGNLLVQDGASTVSSEDITTAGVFEVPLPPGGIMGTANTAMTLTLAAAGAAVTGKINGAKLTA